MKSHVRHAGGGHALMALRATASHRKATHHAHPDATAESRESRREEMPVWPSGRPPRRWLDARLGELLMLVRVEVVSDVDDLGGRLLEGLGPEERVRR